MTNLFFHVRRLSIFVFFLVATTLVSAQDIQDIPTDPGVLANGDLDPSYRQQYPSQGSATITNPNSSDMFRGGNCQTIRFLYSSGLSFMNGTQFHSAQSSSVDGQSYAYCNIQRIGTRARLWISGNLQNDSGVVNVYNNSFGTASASSPQIACQSSSFGRGNHEFQQGVSLFTYVTEDSVC